MWLPGEVSPVFTTPAFAPNAGFLWNMGLIWDEVLAREQAYVIPTKGVNLANQHAPADQLSRFSSAHSTASWLSTREACQRRGFGPIPSAGCLVVGPCAAGSGTPCRAAEGLEVSPRTRKPQSHEAKEQIRWREQ